MILQRLWRQWAPPWFDGPNISTFYESTGALLDPLSQRVLDARLAAIPWAGPGAGIETPLTATGQRIECQPDALPYHSADRAITLYPTEGLLSQRIRLASFRQLHARRGTHWGEIEHVRPYFADTVALGYAYPAIDIVFQTNEATPSAVWSRVASDGTRTRRKVSPSNFNYDGRAALRTRWWAFVRMAGTGFAPPLNYDEAHGRDEGNLYDEGGARPFTAGRCADVAAMFGEWHSAHSWLGGVALVWDPAAVDPTTTPTQDADGRWSLPNGANTWGAPGGVDPGTGKATRPYGVQWIYDNPAP